MFSLIAKLFGMETALQPVNDLQRLKNTSLREKQYDINRPDLVNKARQTRRDPESMALVRKEDRGQSAWTAGMADRIYNKG